MWYCGYICGGAAEGDGKCEQCFRLVQAIVSLERV